MPKSSDVVVTGVGPVTAIGIGVDEFWTSLLDGRLAVHSLQVRDDDGPTPHADYRDHPLAGTWIGAPIVGFDGAQFVRPRKAMKVMARELQTAFAASEIAIQRSGLRPALESGHLAADRVSTVFGSQMFYGPLGEIRDAIRNSRDESGSYQLSRFGDAAMRDIMPLWMLKYLPNMPACHVGIAIGAFGANNTIVSGDVSASSAVMESIGVLRRGIADAVVCGGVGSMLDATHMVYRGDAPVPRIADPIERSSRPHATDASGVVAGEGASSLIVELADSAIRRQAPMLARITGTASRFAPPPHGKRGSSKGIAMAVRAALEQADLGQDQIGLIVSHGTGDPLRDAAERTALDEVLPHAAVMMPTGSIGHSGAAVGAVNTLIGVLAIQNRVIPPSLLNGPCPAGWEARFDDRPRPLDRDAVVVLTHTSQGVANAIVLRSID
jgi:3-oxoacyl-[acyl-carrier-protein] synthase II